MVFSAPTARAGIELSKLDQLAASLLKTDVTADSLVNASSMYHQPANFKGLGTYNKTKSKIKK
jgi:hypothetical protein